MFYLQIRCFFVLVKCFLINALIYLCMESTLELGDKSTLHGKYECCEYSQTDTAEGYIWPKDYVKLFLLNDYEHYCRCEDAYNVYKQEWHKVVALALKVGKEQYSRQDES